MSDKIGLIEETVRLVKKDEELITRIIKSRELKEEDRPRITEMLRYNVWTTIQFSELTGLAVSTIANKCRPAYKNGEVVTELDYCYPFGDITQSGPKFIVRNEKSEALLP